MFSEKRLLSILSSGALATATVLMLLHSAQAYSQTTIPLGDLLAFKTTGKTWAIGADAIADLTKPDALSVTPGTGVLANLPGTNGADLFTNAVYGDVDIELDYMMAKGANSGIYLQGRYEIQLLDSWTVKNPTAGDNGAIYQRWNDSKPAGQQGYEGYPPRQNASRAPGLWQQLKVSFQAPRFDAGGKKTSNAKFLRIELNGVLIHEDVALSGPTRGAMSNEESATGPLRFQGDHGPVAFRNIRVTAYDKPRPEFANVSYQVFKGRYYDTLDLKKMPPEAKGTLAALSAGSISNLPKEFFIKYSGTIRIKEPGDYTFNLAVPGGRGIMKINDNAVPQGRQRAKTNLPAGDFPFELLYTKNEDWSDRSLDITIAGPGIREYILGDASTANRQSVDPILVSAPANTVLRSFMDIPGSRVVHAISVGSPDNTHYTYDLDKGAIVQVWRGGFLDATPMWYDRGDGSSRPLGAVLRFGKPAFTMAKLASPDESWIPDSAADFTPKGYRMDKNNLPTFLYMKAGSMVEDAIKVLNNGEGFTREITVINPAGTYYARLASAKRIESTNGMYVIDDRSYYIRIEDAGSAKPVIRTVNGLQELVVPVQTKIRYSIIF